MKISDITGCPSTTAHYSPASLSLRSCSPSECSPLPPASRTYPIAHSPSLKLPLLNSIIHWIITYSHNHQPPDFVSLALDASGFSPGFPDACSGCRLWQFLSYSYSGLIETFQILHHRPLLPPLLLLSGSPAVIDGGLFHIHYLLSIWDPWSCLWLESAGR